MGTRAAIGRDGKKPLEGGAAPPARRASQTESEQTAVKQYRVPAHFLQHAARGALDGRTMARESVGEIALARRRGAEMILERFRRDRALHAPALDERGKRENEIGRVIFRRDGRKRDLHGAPLMRTCVAGAGPL